jgi:hypothetical protein
LKIKLRSKSSHKTIKNNRNRSNLHLINYPNFRSNFIEFNDLKNNNKSLNYSLNATEASKYKNISHFSDIKYINDSFSNIEHQTLYDIFSNMFIYFLIEKSKLVDTAKSLSKILKIFSPEIKGIYIKMLDYLNNYKPGKLYKIINKNTFVNEMINAYNNILTKREQNILLKRNNNILNNYIPKKEANNDRSFGSENISPICFKNNLRAISFGKKNSNFVNNTISF